MRSSWKETGKQDKKTGKKQTITLKNRRQGGRKKPRIKCRNGRVTAGSNKKENIETLKIK